MSDAEKINRWVKTMLPYAKMPESNYIQMRKQYFNNAEDRKPSTITAEQVIKARMRAHLKQNELATLAGVHRSEISSCESGRTRVSRRMEEKLRSVLNFEEEAQ